MQIFAEVVDELLPKQSVRPLYVFTGSLKKCHSGRSCQDLCMLIIQRTLLKWYDEFPQGEFLFMLRHGEHISVCVEHLFESCFLKSRSHANYSLCSSRFFYFFSPSSYSTTKTLITPTELLLQSKTPGRLHKANH